MNWAILLAALVAVESSGDPDAIGDNGLAFGCLQLHAAYVQDAAQFAGKTWRHEDAFNPATAEQIVRAIWLAMLRRNDSVDLRHMKTSPASITAAQMGIRK